MSLGPLPPGTEDRSQPIEAIVGKVTLYSLLLLVVPLLPYLLLYGWGTLWAGFRPLLLIVLLVVFTLAHEGFHLVGWKYWGDLPWSEMAMGMKWEALTPYAHAKAPMRTDAYRLGALLPGVMTGLVPYVMALVLGDATMVILSATMISGAVGDLYVVWTLRDLPPEARVQDHPENIGCLVFPPTQETDSV